MLTIQAAGSGVIGWLDDNAVKPCADEYTRAKEYDWGRSGINSRNSWIEFDGEPQSLDLCLKSIHPLWTDLCQPCRLRLHRGACKSI